MTLPRRPALSPAQRWRRTDTWRCPADPPPRPARPSRASGGSGCPPSSPARQEQSLSSART